VLNDTAGNGHQVTQYEGVPDATTCCLLCYKWNLNPPQGAACALWTYVANDGKNTDMCWLHNTTSTYPRGSTLSGLPNTTMTTITAASLGLHSGNAAPPGWPNNTINVTTPYVQEFMTSLVRPPRRARRPTSTQAPVGTLPLPARPH